MIRKFFLDIFLVFINISNKLLFFLLVEIIFNLKIIFFYADV